MPFPTSNRDFVYLITVYENETQSASGKTLRSFVVISIPVSHPNQSGFVRGKYAAIEQIKELEEEEGIEWTMATSSDPGGSIPRTVSDLALPSKISEDVPSFTKWLEKNSTKGAGNEGERPIE